MGVVFMAENTFDKSIGFASNLAKMKKMFLIFCYYVT
jgi:hypothetical protein